MPVTPHDAESVASVLLMTSVWLAVAMTAIVVVERAIWALVQARSRYIERRYGPLFRRALDGDETALAQMVAGPGRHRLSVAKLIIGPLIDDRDPVRIARTRAIVHALSINALADRYLRSWLWWRRAIALRAFGMIQARDRTAAVVAALDDAHPDVRAAALDALTDLNDLAALPALVVRLHDATLHHGRRLAALAAFGPQCEDFLLELSRVDDGHLLNYARALAICGTTQSRPVLARWTGDRRPEVRAAAFEALAHVGVDADAARLAVEALASGDARVRAMAAYALDGWNGGTDAATHLAQHLDDAWPVAVRAARALRSMGGPGTIQLEARASRSDLAGLLARQMLSPMGQRC